MEQGRYDFSLTALNGKLYAVGGTSTSSQYTNVAECYDVKENKWGEVKSVTGSTYRHGATVVGDKLYVAGGERGAIQYYDPVSNKCECLLAKKRVCHMCGIEDILYILWTDDDLNIRERNCYCFSISSDRRLPPLPSKNHAKLISAYVENGNLTYR